MGDAVFWLFIDDLRDSPDVEWVVARSSSEAISLLKERGCPARISFDHDLGGDDTAMVVAKWLIDTDLDCSGRFLPDKFDFSVHSANPVGAAIHPSARFSYSCANPVIAKGFDAALSRAAAGQTAKFVETPRVFQLAGGDQKCETGVSQDAGGLQTDAPCAVGQSNGRN